MRGTFGLPATDCLLETQTRTHPPTSNTLILPYSMKCNGINRFEEVGIGLPDELMLNYHLK